MTPGPEPEGAGLAREHDARPGRGRHGARGVGRLRAVGVLGDKAALCTYTVKVTSAEAAESPNGAWHVGVLASAENGGTTFAPKAAGFTVKS